MGARCFWREAWRFSASVGILSERVRLRKRKRREAEANEGRIMMKGVTEIEEGEDKKGLLEPKILMLCCAAFRGSQGKQVPTSYSSHHP